MPAIEVNAEWTTIEVKMVKDPVNKRLVGIISTMLETNMSKLTHFFLWPSEKGRLNDARFSKALKFDDQLVFGDNYPCKMLLARRDDMSSNASAKVNDYRGNITGEIEDKVNTQPYFVYILIRVESPR